MVVYFGLVLSKKMGNYPRLLKGIQKTFKISEMTQGNINKYFDTDIYPKRKRLAEDVWAWAKAQQTREEIERINFEKLKQTKDEIENLQVNYDLADEEIEKTLNKISDTRQDWASKALEGRTERIQFNKELERKFALGELTEKEVKGTSLERMKFDAEFVKKRRVRSVKVLADQFSVDEERMGKRLQELDFEVENNTIIGGG